MKIKKYNKIAHDSVNKCTAILNDTMLTMNDLCSKDTCLVLENVLINLVVNYCLSTTTPLICYQHIINKIPQAFIKLYDDQ